jgi:hypothetical protein
MQEYSNFAEYSGDLSFTDLLSSSTLPSMFGTVLEPGEYSLVLALYKGDWMDYEQIEVTAPVSFIIPPELPPAVIEGPVTITNTDSDAVFTLNSSFSSFAGASILSGTKQYPLTLTASGDGFMLRNTDLYSGASLGSAMPGSIIIKLYRDFLTALDNGEYTLMIYLQDGSSVEKAFALDLVREPVDKTIVSVTPTAHVNKLNGNQNRLFITVTIEYSDGTTEEIDWDGLIDNNAAETYYAGGYKVYVDTKGNIQVRECYIVD